ncbi:MAG: NAD-dependent epimerase/dehydratase family protein [Candidatus Nanopelagicaceae bacterium]
MAVAERIVITGAGGHVGGRLLKQFCSIDHHNLRPHFRIAPTMPEWASGCVPTYGDLRDASTRRKLLTGADVVVHLATRGYSSSRQPSPLELEDEYSTLMALIQESIALGIRCFVFISSIHVLGSALAGDVTERTTPLPSSEYGRSRLRMEMELHERCSATDMKPIVLRLANTFGVPAFPKNATWDLLIHDLCRQAVKLGRLQLTSDGSGYRNILALGDAADAIAQIATKRIASGTYLLAGPRTYRVHEIAELVRSRAECVLGEALTVEFDQAKTTVDHSFTIHPSSLNAFGVAVGNRLIEEMDELLRLAHSEFAK